MPNMQRERENTDAHKDRDEEWSSESSFPDISSLPEPDSSSSSSSSSSTSTSASELSSTPSSIQSIRGNVSSELKLSLLHYFNVHLVDGREASFASEVGKRLRMREVDVWGVNSGVRSKSRSKDSEKMKEGHWNNCYQAMPLSSIKSNSSRLYPISEPHLRGRGRGVMQAQTVFEITVTKDMCNPLGTLHGACAAYIVDPCSLSAIVVLGAALGIDGTGVSQSMNLIWHQGAKIGTTLRVVSTSVFIQGRIRTSRVELWDGEEEDKLYVSAVHSTINNSTRGSAGGSRPESVPAKL